VYPPGFGCDLATTVALLLIISDPKNGAPLKTEYFQFLKAGMGYKY
jgi:hypothetical protein